MNFTREPIIETVITPREGCKLAIRNTKGVNQEDYVVEAVEVVSFGHSFFFRSLERPKSFLVPVSDYEIIELKETRMVLKTGGSERSIKIAGGAAPARHPSRPEGEESRASDKPVDEPMSAHGSLDRSKQQQGGRRHRTRRRRGGGGEMPPRSEEMEAPQSMEERPDSFAAPAGSEREEEVAAVAAPSFISKLFPPPPTLIKETLSRYKMSEEGVTIEEKPAALNEGGFEHSHKPGEDLPPLDDETKFED